MSCYEAGYDGFWLDRRLRQHRIENQIVDAASIEVSRRARRAKSDRLDAEGLLRVLMRWWDGDRQACRMERVPNLSEEDAKRPSREHQRLVKERVQHVNRIKGLLMQDSSAACVTKARPVAKHHSDRSTADGIDRSPNLAQCDAVLVALKTASRAPSAVALAALGASLDRDCARHSRQIQVGRRNGASIQQRNSPVDRT